MNILVADDHALVREGLRPFLDRLDASVSMVEAWDADSLWSAAHAHPGLDLALVDLNMPGMQGARSIGALRDAFPALPVVVLSGIESPIEVESALRQGAAGYILKGSTVEVIVSAIRLVLAGGQYLPPSLLLPRVADVLGDALASTAPTAPRRSPAVRALSQRQQEVVDLLAQGLSNKMIGRRLGLTEGTVKSHMVQIFQVLGVRNRTAAVLAAQRTDDRQERQPPADGSAAATIKGGR